MGLDQNQFEYVWVGNHPFWGWSIWSIANVRTIIVFNSCIPESRHSKIFWPKKRWIGVACRESTTALPAGRPALIYKQKGTTRRHTHTHARTHTHTLFKKHPIIGHHGRSWQATHRSCSQRTGAVAAIRCCKQFELKLTHCLFMLSSNIFLVTSGRFYFFVCNILQHLMVAEQRVPVFMSSRFEI